jgi:photosystem II stability/assembly factor-like uncharacterized protein
VLTRLPASRPIVCLLLLLVAAPLSAASRWTALGPFGAYVLRLSVDPTDARVLYASLGIGAYKSLDGGITWTPLLKGFIWSNVAVDPLHPNVLYVAAFPGKILKSVDRGAHWSPSGQGLEGPDPTLLAVDPVRPSRLYAASFGRIWRSVNSGASWQPSPHRFPQGEGSRFIALVASRPAGTVFAGTGNGLLKSVDGGLSWKPAGTGLPAGPFDALAVAPTDPKTIYVNTGVGLFRSTDGGARWQAIQRPPLQPGILNFVNSLAVSARSPRTVYAGTFNNGLFRSVDGGAHWTKSSPRPFADVAAVATSPASPQSVYAALHPDGPDFGGVFASGDGGSTWQRRNRGLAGLDAGTFAVDPVHPGVLWVGLGQGLFRSGNAGQRWARSPVPVPDPDFPAIHRLALDPADPSTVYAIAGRSLWRTTDGGASWTEVHAPTSPVPLFFEELWIDPAVPAKLWASTGTRLYQSTDGGTTWRLQPAPMPGCDIFDLEFAPSSPATIYISAGDQGIQGCRYMKPTFFRSTDGGATWTRADAGLSSPGPRTTIGNIGVDPVDSRLVYVATGNDGVLKSTDGGATWARAGDALKGKTVSALAASPIPGVVWAGIREGHIFRSGDGGATWEERSAGLQTYDFWGLTIDASNPRKIYTFTWNGLWILEDDAP